MTLEDLIYNRLIKNAELSELLARFKNIPAVFYQSAPGDQATGWKNKKQYPRIDFIVDMQANPERQASGIMLLNIWCSEDGIAPEEIEPIVRNAFCDIFMTPTELPPYCLSWVRSDSFEMKANATKETNVIGVSVSFDILAFPVQETSNPDPILAMNKFLKEWNPAAVVIGANELPSTFSPTINNPAFYFRIASMELARETNTVAWMNASLAGHIFAPTTNARLQWLKYLVDTLAVKGEITMLDTSPMFLTSIKADSSADRLTVGQIRLFVRFGILRKTGYSHTLMRTNIPREIIEADNANISVKNKTADGYKIVYPLAGETE